MGKIYKNPLKNSRRARNLNLILNYPDVHVLQIQVNENYLLKWYVDWPQKGINEMHIDMEN
jgi:hypothetical protein